MHLIGKNKIQGKTISAIIVAGGRGERLHPLTKSLPKPLIPINGEPMLAYIIRQLVAQSLTHVTIAIHYLANKISEAIRDGEQLGAKINYLEENIPLGTAGALFQQDLLANDFSLLINGDVLCEFDVEEMVSLMEINQADVMVATTQQPHQLNYGVIRKGKNNLIERVIEKPVELVWVNAGIYIFRNSTLKQVVPADEVISAPVLINTILDKGYRVGAYNLTGFWYDIGTIESLKIAEEFLQKHSAKV